MSVSKGFKVKKANFNNNFSSKKSYKNSFSKNVEISLAKEKRINSIEKKYRKKDRKFDKKFISYSDKANSAKDYLEKNSIKTVKKKQKPFKYFIKVSSEILKSDEDDNLATEGVFRSIRKASAKVSTHFYEKRKTSKQNFSLAEKKKVKYTTKKNINDHFAKTFRNNNYEYLDKSIFKRFITKRAAIKEYKLLNGLTWSQNIKFGIRRKLYNVVNNLNHLFRPLRLIIGVLRPILFVALLFIISSAIVNTILSLTFSSAKEIESMNLGDVIKKEKITIDEVDSNVSKYKDFLKSIENDIKEQYKGYSYNSDTNSLNNDTSDITAYIKAVMIDKLDVSKELYGLLDELYITDLKVNEATKSIKYIITLEDIEKIAKKNLSSEQLKVYEENKRKTKILPGTKTGVVVIGWQNSITSVFGWRANIWGNAGKEWHTGIDIAQGLGTPVYAYSDGTVIYAGWNNYGYGNLLIIKHNNRIQTYYAHLNAFHVREGDVVVKGQHIADMGTTGNSTGPHLHFEYRIDNEPVNPYYYLLAGEKNE
ncbi:M23 family metallopeptidase [Peptoniphilaceae bacterium SGI.131]